MTDIRERMAAMAQKVAEEGEEDTAFGNVDQAVDMMVRSVQVISENLPKVKTDNAPQKAALDIIKETMEQAIEPYLLDIVKAIDSFGQ